MTLSISFKSKLEDILLNHTGRGYKIIETKPALGGSINESSILITDKGHFFLKVNDEKNSLENFEAEAHGLKLLKQKSAFTVPLPIAAGAYEKQSFLLMDYLHKGVEDDVYWEAAAEKLAFLHKTHDELFGLEINNFIGKLPQQNTRVKDFDNFFFSNRIEPQVRLARDKGLLDKYISPSIDRLHRNFMHIVPHENPSLIHGDLWSGNIMPVQEQGPSIYDPSVSYAHREMDIAMTKLFGGFHNQFYKNYDHFYPLAKGWEERVDIFNLYPLLVHVNMFGGSYISQVLQILKRF